MLTQYHVCYTLLLKLSIVMYSNRNDWHYCYVHIYMNLRNLAIAENLLEDLTMVAGTAL